MSESASNDSKAGQEKVSRRAFPRMPLNRTLDLVTAVSELGHGEPVRRVSAFNHLNRSADSGPSRQQVATANSGYGLLKGNATSPYLELTERGQALVSSSDEVERRRLIYEALMDNAIFKASVDRYRDRALPSDEVFSDFIKKSFGLGESDSTLAVGVIKENLSDHGLIERVAGGREIVVAPDTALANLPPAVEQPGDLSPQPNGVEVPPPASGVVGTDSHKSEGHVLPQIAFNIQIQLPSDASPDTYEAIFKNIAAYLLGRGEE